MKNVLVVAAHPDDELLGIGGTVRRLADEGICVRAVILAEGLTSLLEAGKDRVLLYQAKDGNPVLEEMLQAANIYTERAAAYRVEAGTGCSADSGNPTDPEPGIGSYRTGCGLPVVCQTRLYMFSLSGTGGVDRPCAAGSKALSDHG